MSFLPLSPPLTSSRNPTPPPIDNAKANNDQRRMKPERPICLRPSAGVTANPASIPSKAIFKVPALPSRSYGTASVSMHDTRIANIHVQHHASVTSNESLTGARLQEHIPRPMTVNTAIHPVRGASYSMAEESANGLEGGMKEQQSASISNLQKHSVAASVAKDLGSQNESQLELHQRVNKHVNTYLKNACSIPGGYKLHTERQAWNILSTLAPLDLTTNPEVFEPLDTDQLAKFLNHRRKSLEEFQESKMPMPGLPLLPSTNSVEFKTDAQRENAELSLQWGLQGVVNRGKWTITQADLAMIKSELISLQRARKRFDGLPPLLLQLPPSEEIEEKQLPGIQPLKNSVKDFREITNACRLLPVDDTSDEMESLLGANKLKITDVCDLSLSITQEEIGMVKEELQQMTARKGINPEQRMRSVALSSAWERCGADLPFRLNDQMTRDCLSPPIASLLKAATATPAPLRDILRSINISSTASLPRTSGHTQERPAASAQAIKGAQKLLDAVEPLSPSFSDQRYKLNLDTPTLAASSSFNEYTSSSTTSPTRETGRDAKEFHDALLQYEGPAIDEWDAEKMEVPLVPDHKQHLSSATFHEYLPTLFAGHSIFPVSSSPEAEVLSLADTSDLPADRLLRNLFCRKGDKDSRTRSLDVDLPGLTVTPMPDCAMGSVYMKVPDLPSMTQANPYRRAVFMPKSIKDFISTVEMESIAILAACKGVQSLAYELSWSLSMEGYSNVSASDLLSQPTSLSTETCSVPISQRRYAIQDCVLQPPLALPILEYTICHLEPSVALQTQQTSHEETSLKSFHRSRSSLSSSDQTTDVRDVIIESHSVYKKRRTALQDDIKIPHPATADGPEKLARVKAPNCQTQSMKRPYDQIEKDLDELVCSRDHSVNRVETGKPPIKLPSTLISRLILTRVSASASSDVAPSSSSNTSVKGIDQGGQHKFSAEPNLVGSRESNHLDAPILDERRPMNCPEISLRIYNVIRSAKTLPVLPIMTNTSIYNKRRLCSALHELQFQLYGHDQVEADFILNLKTACVLLPLAYITAGTDELLQKLVELALTFESLIVIFEMYPSRSSLTDQAALPDPWNPSTQLAFNQFEGRLKRQIMWKVVGNSGFQHNINVYLSDNASTVAGLLRLHANLEPMPVGTLAYRQLDENDINDTYAWLSMDMEREECEIRHGLQLNSAAALYIAHEYGAAAFLQACQSRNNDTELFELLGSWNMQTTGDIVRARAAEAKRVEDEESVGDGPTSQFQDCSPAMTPREHKHTSLENGSREILGVPPVAIADTNNSSYSTDFEDIAVDQDLQAGSYYSGKQGPAYFEEDGPAFITMAAHEEEPDELNLNYFEWN